MSDSAPEISSSWRAWVAENLANGADEQLIIDGLVGGGVGIDEARFGVERIMRTIDLDIVAQLVEGRRRRQAIIDLQRKLIGSDEIRTHEGPLSASEFFDHYFAANRPVLLPGFAAGWPATEKWSLDWFASEFGDVSIGVCKGRTSSAAPDRNYEQHVIEMPLADFIAELIGAGATNDLYAISNNKLMELPEFARLLDDVQPDPAVFPVERRVPGSVALWIGPPGTITPLHHDTTNVMFCQIAGRKKVSLVAPLETAVADGAIDFYAECDVDSARWREMYSDVAVRTVEVGPGDAVFIPVGWWHRVEALEPSISFVLLGFAEPNDYTWYRPGSVRT